MVQLQMPCTCAAHSKADCNCERWYVSLCAASGLALLELVWMQLCMAPFAQENPRLHLLLISSLLYSRVA